MLAREMCYILINHECARLRFREYLFSAVFPKRPMLKDQYGKRPATRGDEARGLSLLSNQGGFS